MMGTSTCCPDPSSRHIAIFCSKLSPVQPGAHLLNQQFQENTITERLRFFKCQIIPTHCKFFWIWNLGRIPSSYSWSTTCQPRAPRAPDGQECYHCFSGRNTAFRDYLLPISRGKYHIWRKKEKKGILRSVLSCSSWEFGMSWCIKRALY